MHLIILIVISGLLFFEVLRVLKRRRQEKIRVCQQLRTQLVEKSSQNKEIHRINLQRAKELEDLMMSYNIAREICKYLDEDKVANHFIQFLKKYPGFSGVKFLKETVELPVEPKYEVIPLQVDKDTRRYLAAKSLDPGELEVLQILSQQLLLGLTRAHLYQKVQSMVIKDSLTAVLSRRFVLERLEEEVKRSKKFGYTIAFCMVDIDHFKECNDRYGHLVGDAILRQAARTIKDNIRQIDLVGRYGGEEFCVILPETNREGSLLAAERIRKGLQEREIRAYDESLHLTMSIGIALYPDDAKDISGLIEKADQSLYKAKESGRNRVCG